MASHHSKTADFLLPNVTTCIVACSAAEARLFLSERRYGEWTSLQTLDNPAATLRERDRNSDRPGRVHDRYGKGRHAHSAEESARQHELENFASDIAQVLARAHAAGRFRSLILIAEPTILGHLRHKLSSPLKRALCCEVPRNPSGFDLTRLREIFA